MTLPAGGETLGGPVIRAHLQHPVHRRRIVAAAAVALAAVVATAAPAAARSDGSRYQVRRGDTLSGIAAELGVSTSRLASANGLADPNLVVAGTWLTLPGSGSDGGTATGSSGATGRSGSGGYTVRPGDTLSDIAARHGLSAGALADANGIGDPNLVVAGTTLAIPGIGSGSGGGASSQAPTATAAYATPSSGSSSLPLRLRQSPSRLALMGSFDRWAATYGVPADLLKAVTWLESGWQQGVVSSTGAVGIGQLMPDTVTTLNNLMDGSYSPWVPDDNIRMSARYLRLLLDMTGGSSTQTLAGYYQGLRSVQTKGMYTETLAYVNGVQALRGRFG